MRILPFVLSGALLLPGRNSFTMLRTTGLVCTGNILHRTYHRQTILMRSKKSNANDIWNEQGGNISSKKLGSKVVNQKTLAPLYKPKSAKQRRYVDALSSQDTSIVFGTGPAGCGKTLFACLQGIQMLKSGAVKKLVLTRPIVPVEEEEIGFLPGTLAKKMDPWTRPILDTLLEFYHQKDLDEMFYNGVIEICPLAFMRGRTFKHAFIIADEMQNSTPNQMLMLTTRIGDHCKMVITGDLKQTDRVANNGLLDFIRKHNAFMRSSTDDDDDDDVPERKLISLIEMDASDVQRSRVVSHILNIYSGDENHKALLRSSQFQSDYFFNGDDADTDADADNNEEGSEKSNGTDDAALIPKKDVSHRYPLE
jgi:phosphate starvation-inducible protein PhoH